MARAVGKLKGVLGCAAVFLILLVAVVDEARAQTRIMPLGDSITHGGQNHVSYRYELWFALQNAAYSVDFVGQRDFTNDGNPDPSWYPDYYTTFDRDHEGYWGWRTDEIAGIVLDAAGAAQPDIVLVHLGTNDIGQLGAAGVTNADTNLRLIIERLRAARPDVTILLAQVIPIGPGSSYFANAAQVGPLNSAIAAIASDLDTPQSPVLLVDQNSGFDLATMMQPDGLHPNLAGESQMAAVWQAALEPALPDNPPPDVEITSPAAGATFVDPSPIAIDAEATDPGGMVSRVEFFAGAIPLGVDTTEPFGVVWNTPPVGNHLLTALAEDDEGATRSSSPVAVTVLPAGSGVPAAVVNGSFELPVLPDGDLAPGPGAIGDWIFSGTPDTFVGIFNPPAGSYPEAAGGGTPIGADGSNVAYLFNNGGPGELAESTQLLGETLQDDSEYLLAVAIGKFLPDQPYVFSTFGGYSIELLAGSTVIASDSETIDPPFGEFRDALAVASTHDLSPGSVGEPLSIRLGLPTDAAPRSTHFDDVRLTRFDDAGAGRVPSGPDGTPLLLGKSAPEITLSWSASCLAGDGDYAVYEGALGNFASHAPRTCSTTGATTTSFEPPAAGVYFLVVPRNANREGSHGQDGTGAERPAGTSPCLPRRLATCP